MPLPSRGPPEAEVIRHRHAPYHLALAHTKMRATQFVMARQPLIRFRHGVANQVSAGSKSTEALKLNISNPSPKAALEVKMPHVVKPLGPGVTVVRPQCFIL